MKNISLFQNVQLELLKMQKQLHIAILFFKYKMIWLILIKQHLFINTWKTIYPHHFTAI